MGIDEQLADSNIIGIICGKHTGPIVEANDEFLRMAGYSRDDLEAGKLDWMKMTPPEWNFANRQAMKQMENTGKASPFEKEFFRRDGTRVPVLIGIVAAPQGDRDALCFVMDLTERKETEQALDRLMIERFAMLDSVGDGIYGQDKDGRCTFVNAAAVRLLGYQPEECLGRNMHELVHYKYADGSPFPAEKCPVMQALRNSEGVRVSNDLVWRKDGTALPIEFASQPIVVNGHAEGSVVSFKDIGERMCAEAQLRASEARFRGAFAHAGVGMCITDPEGRFLEVNQAFCRMTGYGHAELVTLTAQSITHPDGGTSDGLSKLLSGAIPGFGAEIRLIRKDGSSAWAHCTGTAWRDAGDADRVVIIAEDITEHRLTAQ